MKLWLLRRAGATPSGEYSGAIVAAAGEAAARETHPAAAYAVGAAGWPDRACFGWVAPGDAIVTPLCDAPEGAAPGVVAAWLAP